MILVKGYRGPGPWTTAAAVVIGKEDLGSVQRSSESGDRVTTTTTTDDDDDGTLDIGTGCGLRGG